VLRVEGRRPGMLVTLERSFHTQVMKQKESPVHWGTGLFSSGPRDFPFQVLLFLRENPARPTPRQRAITAEKR
jgi:hypothetical protein